MAAFEPVSPPQIAAIQQPGCPKCRQQGILRAKLDLDHPASPSVASNGYVSTTAISCDPISDDPMTSDVLGWLASELRPPT